MLETQDLVLRSGCEADWEMLYRNLWSQVEVFRYMFSRPSEDEESARKKTAAYAEMHRAVPTEFFVEEKSSGQVIGIAGVKALQPGKWTITDIALGLDFQGRGYGRQIVMALVKLAFELGAVEVAYECFRENDVSRHLAARCGFCFTHEDKAELPKNGQDVMMAHYIQRK